MKIVKIIGKKISDICLALFIFFIIPAVAFILATSRTSVFGIRSFVVQTGSMKPVIPVGAIVFSKPITSPKVGEIITFKRGDINVTHRIVMVFDKKIYTKGDANNTIDPQTITAKDVIGENFLIIPYLGLITMFVKTIPGFFLVIFLPNLVFIGFEIWNIKEEYRKHIEKKIMHEIKTIEKAI